MKSKMKLIVKLFTEISSECLPPKCKPYASVLFAHCDAVELNITYPRYQHGLNRSTDRWENILCNDEIGGFMLWVVGHGILKRFRQRKLKNCRFTVFMFQLHYHFVFSKHSLFFSPSN